MKTMPEPCACVCTYVHTCLRVHVCVYTCVCALCVHVCLHTCVRAPARPCVRVHLGEYRLRACTD